MKTVAVIGASEKVERTSNHACRLLVESGYAVYAVSPAGRGGAWGGGREVCQRDFRID